MNIVITGTSKGIGQYLTEYYLGKGNTVFGISRSKCDLTHQNYFHFTADVSSEKEISQIALEIRKNYKNIDVLINNAGCASMNHFLLTPKETARRLLDVNFIGTYICSRAFINLLKHSKHPRIVNFTTVAVPLNLEGELAYVSSKSAVEAFTKVLSKEIASFGITVNAIGPTPIKTDLTAKVPKDKLQKLIENQAIKRFGQFSDISNVIDFFISENSDFITGQIIYLGGVNR